MRIMLLGVVLLLSAACAQDADPAGEPDQQAEDGGQPVEPDAAPAPEDEAPAPEESPPAPPDDPEEDPADDGGEVDVEVSELVTGLEAPWDVAFVDQRVFVTERDSGRVLELGEDGERETVATFEIDPQGEGGLLGLTADDEGLLYAYHSTATENRVARFDPDQAEPEVIFDGIPHAGIHNGGRLAFGPDDLLYVATGDANDAAQAQDPESLAGKILRLTRDGQPAPGNPFESAVYAVGLRNVQGLDWDGEGNLWASMFGPDVDDEINVIEAGANYGWPEVTGQHDLDDYRQPAYVAQPAEASWSGLAVLDDGAIPQWEGDVFVAALRGARLWRLETDGTEVTTSEELLVDEYGRLRHVTQAPDGSLWLLTNDTDGRGDPGPEDDRLLRLGPPR